MCQFKSVKGSGRNCGNGTHLRKGKKWIVLRKEKRDVRVEQKRYGILMTFSIWQQQNCIFMFRL